MRERLPASLGVVAKECAICIAARPKPLFAGVSVSVMLVLVQVGLYFRNTVVLAIGSWACQIVVATTAGFALSVLRPKYGRVLMGLVLPTLKDPEWVPPEPAPSKGGKTSLGGGGGGQGQGEPNSPPPVVKVPFEVQRAMSLRAQKAALLLGDRVLPQAGLIFFPYRGKDQSIKSVELIYSGSAGKATLTLRP